MNKFLLFDLDNTLYSCRYGLEKNVSRRVKEFAAGVLGVPWEEAWQERKAFAEIYGTCLEWLMAEKGFTDAENYFAAIHPQGEADTLPPDPELRAFLLGIPVPKAILTNSPREHADLVLGKLGLNGIFSHVIDIRQCGFRGKPHRKVYEHALSVLGAAAAEVLFIDDQPLHIAGYAALGGKGLLLDENDVHKDSTLPRIRNIKELTGYL